ncbi:hypothetical protein J4474_04560 [Candidatus Pacearchaeota archaeon]|nr:hypothetical protein [Candidatus Pacearchaeota archaeon]
MVLTDKRRRFEDGLNEKLREVWDGDVNGRSKYLFAVSAPGTRVESDFRVQIDVYEIISRNADRTMTIRSNHYEKIDEGRLKSLAIPKFFLKMGQQLKEYIGQLNNKE